jgi:hypothetical protein
MDDALRGRLDASTREIKAKYTLPDVITHIATDPHEIAAHGEHMDMISDASFGSVQVRVDPHGYVIDTDANLSHHEIAMRTGHGGYVNSRNRFSD